MQDADRARLTGDMARVLGELQAVVNDAHSLLDTPVASWLAFDISEAFHEYLHTEVTPLTPEELATAAIEDWTGDHNQPLEQGSSDD